MKKILGLLSIIIVSFVISGCVAAVPGDDFSYDVSKGYRVRCLSSKIWLEEIETSDTDINDKNKIVIDEQIDEIAWNDKYILVKQLGYSRDYSKKDFKFIDENKVQYWIVDVDNRICFGGYELKEFKAKQRELGIFGEFELKPVRSFLDSMGTTD